MSFEPFLLCACTYRRLYYCNFAHGKAIFSGGRPYLATVAREMGLQPDKVRPDQATLRRLLQWDDAEMGGVRAVPCCVRCDSAIDEHGASFGDAVICRACLASLCYSAP